MALTTRQFVLRHVIDNSSMEETMQTENHLGYRWTTKVTANDPNNLEEIQLEFWFPDAGLVGYHEDSEIWVSPRFLDANGKVTHEEEPDCFDVPPVFGDEFWEEYDEVEDAKGDNGPGNFAIEDYFKKKEIGLIKKTDVVTMELHIKVKGEFPVKQNIWDFSRTDLTDLVLVAEGKKFNVNRAFLALQSSYFHDLLYREGSSIVELKDLSSETLQDLLEVIYHSSNISESNLRPLLEAARTYDVKLVTEQCKQFLITDNKQWRQFLNFDTKMENSVKKWVAAKFRLGDLTEDPIPSVEARHDFSKADPVLTDMVLVVQGKKFHVNKTILATFSTYFHSMFYSGFQESEQSEIELKNIDPENFQQLLEAIYHCANIHEYNVENLLELARMYDVTPAITQCEKFLMGENYLETEEKRRLAEEYGLVELEETLEEEEDTEEEPFEPAAKRQRTD